VAGRSLITVELERVFIRVADEGTPPHTTAHASLKAVGAVLSGCSIYCRKGSAPGEARFWCSQGLFHEARQALSCCPLALFPVLCPLLCCGYAEYQLELLLQSLQYVQVR